MNRPLVFGITLLATVILLGFLPAGSLSIQTVRILAIPAGLGIGTAIFMIAFGIAKYI